jgi:hypothetical protein
MDLQQFFIAHQSRRDVLRTPGMLVGFDFNQDANYYPKLPKVL